MNYYGQYPQSYNQGQANYQPNMQGQAFDQYSGVRGQSPLMNPSSGITWVQGEIGARAYPVGAGNSVLLMDSEDKYFYIKSADMSGMPKMHKYYYSEVVGDEPRMLTSNASEPDTSQNNAQIEQISNEINELKMAIQELTNKMGNSPANG